MSRAHGRYFDAAFALACAVALAFWLWLGNGLTFFLDEWSFIKDAHDWSFDAMMQPLNSHWSLTLNLIWKSLMATVGMSSYLPYQLVANVFHIAAACGIYVFARRVTVPLAAFFAGLVFLFLGSGYIDFVLGLQMNFNLASAAGIWALVILLREPRPRHSVMAAVLLLIAVASNGVGLPFPLAAVAIVFLSRARWRQWWVPIPAIVAFTTWYLAYGRQDRVVLPNIPQLVSYVIDGVAHAFGQVTGFGAEVGLVLAVLFTVAALANIVSGERLRLGLIAGMVGVISLFIIIGLAKAVPQPESYPSGRFVDVAAVFVLLAIVGLLAHRKLGRPGEAHGVALAILLVGGFALVWNVNRALGAEDRWRDRAHHTRAAYMLMADYGGSPAVAADRGFGYRSGGLVAPLTTGGREWLPGPDEFGELIERYGSPAEDPLAFRSIEVPDAVVDDLFARAAAGSLTVGPGELPAESLPLTLEMTQNVTTDAVGQCEILEATGPEPWVEVVATSGASLAAMSDAGGNGSVAVSLHGTYPVEPVPVELTAGDVTRIGIPDFGAGTTMLVRFAPPAEGLTMLCLEAQPD